MSWRLLKAMVFYKHFLWRTSKYEFEIKGIFLWFSQRVPFLYQPVFNEYRLQIRQRKESNVRKFELILRRTRNIGQKKKRRVVSRNKKGRMAAAFFGMLMTGTLLLSGMGMQASDWPISASKMHRMEENAFQTLYIMPMKEMKQKVAAATALRFIMYIPGMR